MSLEVAVVASFTVATVSVVMETVAVATSVDALGDVVMGSSGGIMWEMFSL